MSSSSNGTNTYDSLAEVFCCFICMEKLSDARLCPHCSKLCCYQCIRTWLADQHQECPHCRAPLRLNDLVICRWVEDVITQLASLKMNGSNKKKNEEKEKCELHEETLSVYCSSCLKCICHQCALFNKSHTGHHFLPLDDVYKVNISIINERLELLKRRHVELICLIQDIERNVDTVKATKRERIREIRNAMQTMQTNIDEQFKIKFDALNVQHDQLTNETEFIERALHEIEHCLSSNSKAEIIDKQQDLINSIQSICDNSKNIFNPIPILYDFPSEVAPQFSSSIFIVRNFSIVQQTADHIYSEPLNINGLAWRLKVYPNGNGTVHGIYLSVFLELTSGLNESSKYEYRIEMIHQLSKDSSKNIVRDFTSDFEIGECWGYNRYFPLNELVTEGFLHTSNNTLILRFHVRPPTYQQECRDQQSYIRQLENNNQRLNDEVYSLRGKILSLGRKENLHVELNRDEENPTETVIDIDDKYTSVESDQILNSDENENARSDNDIEHSFNSSCGDHQSIHSEQNIHEEDSNRSDGIPTIKSAVFEVEKSNSITTNDIKNDVHSVSFNEMLPWTSNENFTLSNISEHSTNSDQSNILESNVNQINISSRFPEITNNNNNERSTVASNEGFSCHRPHYDASAYDFIVPYSQNYHSTMPITNRNNFK